MEQANKLTDLTKIKESVDFYDLASHFEEKSLKVNGNSVTMCCSINPDHKDDSPSFSYNAERQSYWCFGCKQSGDVFDYVSKKMNYTNFKDSIEFLSKFTGTALEYVDRDSMSYVPQYKKEMAAISTDQSIDDDKFNYFLEDDITEMMKDRGERFLERGLTKETLDFFNVGFHSKYQRVILPVRDDLGNLVGATGRTVYPDYKERGLPKWQHYKNTKTSKSFFNIHNAIASSKAHKNAVIICEGPNDVMKLHQYGYPNAVACLSNSISKTQKLCLMKNFMTIYLFMDGDTGGSTGKDRILKEVGGYFNIHDVKALEGKDPDDMTKEEVDIAFRNSKKI